MADRTRTVAAPGWTPAPPMAGVTRQPDGTYTGRDGAFTIRPDDDGWVLDHHGAVSSHRTLTDARIAARQQLVGSGPTAAHGDEPLEGCGTVGKSEPPAGCEDAPSVAPTNTTTNTTTDTTWREQAACLGHDPDLFWPQGQGTTPIEAMRICGPCPVRTTCLDYALNIESAADYGVWGGTTEKARRNIRTGRWTPEQAMAAGDRIARRRTDEEIVTERPDARARTAKKRVAARRRAKASRDRAKAAERARVEQAGAAHVAEQNRRRNEAVAARRAEQLEDARIIIGIVAGRHHLTTADLTGPSRERHVVAARHEAMAAVRADGRDLTWGDIGGLFGRDGTTVCHALRKVSA